MSLWHKGGIRNRSHTVIPLLFSLLLLVLLLLAILPIPLVLPIAADEANRLLDL
jgi:hypothetical protein